MKVNPMKRKEVSDLLEQIGEEYGCDAKTLLIEKYVFFISDKNKVYIINEELKDIDTQALRINSFGLYFCEINRGKVRLSIEGSQIIGPLATKNVTEFNDDVAKRWIMGEDIEDWEEETQGFTIIKHVIKTKDNNTMSDFLGCGKYKENRILNFIPKQRRIRE